MRFAADENLNNDLLRGLRARIPDLDIIRVQDSEMYAADDPTLLAWLARENRILLTHDIQTMPGYAYERVRAGLPMPGIIEVDRDAAIGKVLEDLILMILAGQPSDFAAQVRYAPVQ
jgi:hypothetical protein